MHLLPVYTSLLYDRLFYDINWDKRARGSIVEKIIKLRPLLRIWDIYHGSEFFHTGPRVKKIWSIFNLKNCLISRNMIRDVHPRIRILGSKKHRIPAPEQTTAKLSCSSFKLDIDNLILRYALWDLGVAARLTLRLVWPHHSPSLRTHCYLHNFLIKKSRRHPSGIQIVTFTVDSRLSRQWPSE